MNNLRINNYETEIPSIKCNPKEYSHKPSFKASQADSFSYQNEQAMMNAIKKQKAKDDRRKNISLASNILLAGAFVTMAVVGLLSYKQGRPKSVKTLFSQIGDMPALTDDCVNPKVKDFIETTVKLFSTPKNVIEYAGSKNPPRMVLFWGPTGTGKTFSAKLLAKSMGAEYGEVQFSDLSSAYIGQTAVNISEKFAELSKLAQKNPNKKYVVTFNEIDSLINNIETLGSNNLHLGQNRTSFLNGLDSIRDIPNLTIVGTTNINPHSARLDQATLNRLGQIFEIQAPTKKEVVASLKYHLGKSQAAKELLENKSEMEALAEEIVAKGGVQRDVENLADTAIADFAVKIAEKPNPLSEKLTSSYIRDAINRKEVWAASIKNDNPALSEETMAQFAARQDILDFIMNFFKGLGSKS